MVDVIKNIRIYIKVMLTSEKTKCRRFALDSTIFLLFKS